MAVSEQINNIGIRKETTVVTARAERRIFADRTGSASLLSRRPVPRLTISKRLDYKYWNRRYAEGSWLMPLQYREKWEDEGKYLPHWKATSMQCTIYWYLHCLNRCRAFIFRPTRQRSPIWGRRQNHHLQNIIPFRTQNVTPVIFFAKKSLIKLFFRIFLILKSPLSTSSHRST